MNVSVDSLYHDLNREYTNHFDAAQPKKGRATSQWDEVAPSSLLALESQPEGCIRKEISLKRCVNRHEVVDARVIDLRPAVSHLEGCRGSVIVDPAAAESDPGITCVIDPLSIVLDVVSLDLKVVQRRRDVLQRHLDPLPAASAEVLLQLSTPAVVRSAPTTLRRVRRAKCLGEWLDLVAHDRCHRLHESRIAGIRCRLHCRGERIAKLRDELLIQREVIDHCLSIRILVISHCITPVGKAVGLRILSYLGFIPATFYYTSRICVYTLNRLSHSFHYALRIRGNAYYFINTPYILIISRYKPDIHSLAR